MDAINELSHAVYKRETGALCGNSRAKHRPQAICVNWECIAHLGKQQGRQSCVNHVLAMLRQLGELWDGSDALLYAITEVSGVLNQHVPEVTGAVLAARLYVKSA